MCGIISLFGSVGQIKKDVLQQGMQSLVHRGPDGGNIWISPKKNVGIGHRRLSIIDPKTGTQPLISRDGNIIVAVNGELYDYQKIRSDLQKGGYIFTTKSDSEIIIPLYEKYGLDFVHHLRGEFAIVLYDKRKNIVIAARDRFGIKPLQYYLSAQQVLYIASEAKALFAMGVPAAWDYYTLYHSFSLQYGPQDRTLFKNVFQLKPGHLLVYDGADLKITKYWDLNFPKERVQATQTYNEEQITNTLERLLAEAVSLRLQTDDAQYCCHVSGGIDSAMIAAMAAKFGKQKLRCFTVSFPHKQYDEREFANSVTKHIGADFVPITVDAPDIIQTLPDAVYFSEGLAINNHLSAKYILHREIRRKGYKIVLTGEGSDEGLAGYIHLKADLGADNAEEIDQSFRTVRGVQFPVGKTLDLNIIQKNFGYIPTFIQAKGAIGYSLHNLLSASFKKRYTPDRIIKDFVHSIDIQRECLRRNRVNQSSYLWIKFALANYILKHLETEPKCRIALKDGFLFLIMYYLNLWKQYRSL